MRILRAFVPVVLVLASGPSGCRPSASPEPLDASSPPADVTSRARHTGRSKGSPAHDLEIRSDGIGPVRIGAAIPPELVKAESYALRLYADAQPLEGFWIGEPPVFAALASGPYRTWLQQSGELDVPPAERFSADALRDANAGATVEMAYVEAAGFTTPEGVGVGTRYDDFMGVYPNAEVGRIPPLFEEPTCVGQAGALPRVHFFFDRCEDGEPPPPGALVVRIAVR